MAQTTSPGWYQAPDGNGQQWWNGVTWSESRRGGAAPVPGPPAAVQTMPIAPSPQAATPVGTTPPVYSADNPAPQRPDPYGRSSPPALAVVNARSLDLSVNRNATIGFVIGLVSVFFIAIAAAVGIVFSVLGINQARALKAQGSVKTGMTAATIGLATNVLGAVMGLAQLIVFIAAIASSVTVSSRTPGFGVLGYLAGF